MGSSKKKILILTESVPFPLTSGGKVCTYNFIDKLRSNFDFSVFFPVYSNDSLENVSKLKLLWPEVNIHCSDLRMLTIPKNNTFLDKILRKSKSFLSLNKSSITKDVRKEKLDFTKPYLPVSEKFIQDLLAVPDFYNFDIIQVQYTHQLNLIHILPEKAIRIFEDIESYFNVLKDFSDTIKLDRNYALYLVRNSEFLEHEYMKKYDAVFTLNSKDSLYLSEKIPNLKVFTSPFGVLDYEICDWKDAAKTFNRLIFSGNEEHFPNYDALEWYLKNVHPLVIKKHKIQLHITGNWSLMSQKYFIKIAKTGIRFEGFVKDYSNFLKNGIMIVPIRIGGGGLRTKTLYAMANGAPVVTTKIGAFGIEGEDKKHFLINDEANQFADSVSKLIVDTEFANIISFSAWNLIREKYSQTSTSALRKSCYEALISC